MALKNRNFQTIMRLHRWLGVFLSLHILLLALTGAVLVFRHELAENPPVKPKALVPVDLQTLVETSLRMYPGDRLLAIGVDHEDSQRVTLRLGLDGSAKFRGARRLTFDRRDGAIEAAERKETGWLHTVLVLHRELFMGTYGKLYVGILGLIYAFILISGLILYGPLMKRMSFGSLRNHLHPRQWWSDLHKYVGALTFAWSLVIGLSGFLLGWGGPIIKFYQASALQDLHAAYAGPQEERPFVSVDTALQAASEASPKGEFSFVSFPGSEFSTAHHYIFVIDGPTPLTEKLSDLVVVNAYSGRVDRILIQPWYLQLLLLAEPLHFGDYAGLPMKILWVILSLFSLVLPLSGLRIFLDRFRKVDRDKLRPVRLRVRPEASVNQRPYTIPLILMVFSWIGLIVALAVDGRGDIWANVSLGAVIVLSIGFLLKNNKAMPAERQGRAEP